MRKLIFKRTAVMQLRRHMKKEARKELNIRLFVQGEREDKTIWQLVVPMIIDKKNLRVKDSQVRKTFILTSNISVVKRCAVP
jgi:hypothetical protein